MIADRRGSRLKPRRLLKPVARGVLKLAPTRMIDLLRPTRETRGAGRSATAPGAGRSATAPGAGRRATAPGAGRSATAPSAGRRTIAPGAGRRATAPRAGRPATAPANARRATSGEPWAPGATEPEVAARRGQSAPPGRRRETPPTQQRRSRNGVGRRRRLTPRARLAIAVLIIVTGLVAGGWLWLRDSSLVSVKHVAVIGATGPDAGQVSAALTATARRMTTLDADVDRLRRAVARYPVVAGLRVTTHFPHRMRIRVIERVPVGTVMVGGRPTAVSGDGMLLPGVGAGQALPALALASSPGGARLTAPDAREEVALLAAAPSSLVARLSQVRVDQTHGLTAQLRGGPILYFGDPARLAAKWIVVAEVLADAGSIGAAYVDVTDPQRPAAGAGNAGTGASAATSTATATTTSASSTSG